MTSLQTLTRLAVLIACMAVPQTHIIAARIASHTSPDQPPERARIAFSHTLPRLDCANVTATVVEVTYGPGESSPPHSHPCAVIGYVIQGSLRTQVKGEAEATYTAGQSFYEASNGVHMISANASDKAPTKFLAYFVCDHDTPLTIAPSETAPL